MFVNVSHLFIHSFIHIYIVNLVLFKWRGGGGVEYHTWAVIYVSQVAVIKSCAELLYIHVYSRQEIIVYNTYVTVTDQYN